MTCLVDSGGVAVDPQQFKWWEPAEWRDTMFKETAPLPHRQVDILTSEETKSKSLTWYHTRGLRKFGRPDISIHDVDKEHQKAVIEMINRFIEMEVLGAVIPEGQKIEMRGLPAGMTCHHTGDVEDPNFNNVHIEVLWPRK